MTILTNVIKIEDKVIIKKIFLIFSYLLSVIIATIVYLTGGTSRVYANLMYLPITLNSSVNDPRQAVIHAIFSGLLIGPFMPLNLTDNLAQPLHNWVIRTVIYAGIALVISYFVYYYKKEHQNKLENGDQLVKAKVSMIHSLVKLTESRDYETGEHIDRVGKYSKFIAEKLGQTQKYFDYLDDDYIEKLYQAVPLHDIGKVSISDQI